MRFNPLIERLKQGETVKFRPHGNSMTPKIKSGQLVTVEPAKNHVIDKGDVVLCKVYGRVFLHLVTAKDIDHFQISNNKGHVNGWTHLTCIYGKLVLVEP